MLGWGKGAVDTLSHPTIMQEVLATLKAGDELPDRSRDDMLRGVLTTSFNTLSAAAQSMVSLDGSGTTSNHVPSHI